MSSFVEKAPVSYTGNSRFLRWELAFPALETRVSCGGMVTHLFLPYAYCGNNPITRIDPDGRDWYQSTNNEDEYIWRKGNKDIDGYTNIGSSFSFQTGENSYLNFYQNAGIKANQAVDAFYLISSSGKLQNQLLGNNSPLSEDSKSALFNSLNSRGVDKIARPVGEALVEYGAGALVGGTVGALGKLGGSLFAKGASRVFWSGGEKAMNAAMEYATANSMTTLEMTRAGKNLTNLTRGMPWSEAGPMWQRLSKVYANGSKGTVHVFQNSQGVGINSVWRTIEYPILKKNGVNIIYNIVK